MTARKLTLEAGDARLVVHTRAVGMLARLAHDLEITATRFEASAELDAETWTGELTIPVAGLEIAGVLKGDRLDRSVLSSTDRADIGKKMREDAFRGAAHVAVRARGTSRDHAELAIVIGGREAKSTAELRVRDDGDRLVVSGTALLSLRALGSREIKAPLGAFSVKDAILILFDLPFR